MNFIKMSRESGEYMKPFGVFQKVTLAMLLMLYRIVSALYHVVYFYFTPFVVTAFVLFLSDVQASDTPRPVEDD